MRVAMLAATPTNTHGWGRHSRDLITSLVAQGIEIVLITSIDAPRQIDLPVKSYHRVLPSLTPAPRFSSLRMIATIPKVRALTANCDLVHVLAEPYVLALLPGKPLIVTAHGTYIPQTVARRATGFLFHYAYSRATIICVSSYTENQVRRVLLNPITTMIPNGVDSARYQKPVPLPEKSAPTILAVGQVKARKGFHILAEAMPEIRKTVPDAQAVFIGSISDEHYRQKIDQGLAEKGLTGAVQWLGRVSEETLLGWYQAADVFALPAINIDTAFEGFGLVYLEASAAGLPAIGTLDCGAEDAIADGKTGYLIPQNDSTALAQAVIRLLCDSDLRTQMGKQGVALASQYTWDRMARQVIAVYEKAMRS